MIAAAVEYLARLSPLRLSWHASRALQRGETPLEFAAVILLEQERLDDINRLLGDQAACRAVIARHAASKGRVWL